VFIHGGCWLNAFDYTHGQALFTALAEAGVNVYALEYRRTGDDGGGWPGSFNDVLAGTNKVLALTQTQQPSVPVSLAGHSAGGHLALLTGQAMPSAFTKVIGLAAITQPAIYAKGTNSCETATPEFFNGTPEDMPEAYKSATPSIENVQFPVVLLQGTADSIVATEQSSLSGATTMLIPGAGHFDFFTRRLPCLLHIIRSIKKRITLCLKKPVDGTSKTLWQINVHYLHFLKTVFTWMAIHLGRCL
jgi:acetyl esterase/lipase